MISFASVGVDPLNVSQIAHLFSWALFFLLLLRSEAIGIDPNLLIYHEGVVSIGCCSVCFYGRWVDE